jgi:hypothetical protein
MKTNNVIEAGSQAFIQYVTHAEQLQIFELKSHLTVFATATVHTPMTHYYSTMGLLLKIISTMQSDWILCTTNYQICSTRLLPRLTPGLNSYPRMDYSLII